MTVDAGYLRNLGWAIPWLWGLCAALWTAWLTSHDKLAKLWLKNVHDKLGRGVYAIRLLICIFVFFIVSLALEHWINKRAEAKTQSPQSTTAKNQIPLQALPPETKTKSQQQKSKPSQSSTVNGSHNQTATGDNNVQQNAGDNSIQVNGNGNNINTIDANLQGGFVPGHEPRPKREDCPVLIPDELVAVFVGGSVTGVKYFPVTIVQVKDKPALVLNRNSDGNVTVTMDIFDSDPNPKLVARIVDNNFKINRLNYFDMQLSKDKSRLQVTDQQGTTVLDFRYLNKNTVSIKAVLHYPGVSDPLIIEDHQVSWKHLLFSDMCVDGADSYGPTPPIINLFPVAKPYVGVMVISDN